ncbi:LacI family DNA-binding transcriptional regulator [Edaphosphingomonas haloaromaticamans]|uniref:HTH-type transcriptional repressor CytR n=1 Tax=Edaphosphingomonas haloaromaticamans TaxID=653954 RepID=A0A1S1HHS3_9SPHN|nr:LacI family DNA-binding transcriptional regulator [Sphingomonas haloaromaticamans]OHT21814.1 HTH-type transcriptional repressor CytR [Sphingomonas haloaromaticamans]
MPKPTIVEVARLAGVSNSTVSRCINNPEKVDRKTLARVRKVIEETGFRPNLLAQSFRRGRTDIVLVVIHNIGSSIFSDIIDGIRGVLGDRYSIILMESRSEEQGHSRFIDLLVARQVVGVILLCSSPPFSRKLVELDNFPRLPVVIGLEPISEDLASLPSVHIDNHQAAFDATRYLLDSGHREIMFVSGERGSLITQDRERGFVAAMAQAGIADGAARILHAELSIQGGIAAAHRLFGRETRPTALFCANDDIALGVMSVAPRFGLAVPADLSIMGFDDTVYAAMANPPLSTVAQPTRDIGERAARRLLRAMERPDETPAGTGELAEILPHRLVIRQSTAPRLA